VLDIVYDPGSGDSRRTRVRPYLLEPLATGRSIYLIGHDETAGAMRTYKVERIRQAILTLDTYEIPDDFDPAKYLAYSWGIWSSDQAPPVEVRLRFDPVVADRVRESVWHRTQQLADLPDGGVEMVVQVAGIIEIRPWILSWGNQVEVMAPEELREAVATATRGAAARYA
jgi:proteasome accessory factor B